MNENIHVYYDIGLEVDHNKDSVSLVPHLATSRNVLKEAMYNYNKHITDKANVPTTNNQNVSAHDSSNQSTIIYDENSNISSSRLRRNQDECDISEIVDIVDNQLWKKFTPPNLYSVLFLTGYGNWHSGNTKTHRIKDSCGSVSLEHNENGMMTGCQAYCPELRMIQCKETQDVVKEMDALASIIVTLIENTDERGEDRFNKLVDSLKRYLCSLKKTVLDEFTTPTSVRIECLMKIDKTSRFLINFSLEMEDTEIGIFNTKDLQKYYKDTVDESVDCLLSLMPSKEKNIFSYKDLSGLSAPYKTACIFHAERLACEFGNLNAQGTIMRYLKKNHFHI